MSDKHEHDKEVKSHEVCCSACGDPFDRLTVQCRGWGDLTISFGYGSRYDGEEYAGRLCDECATAICQSFFLEEDEKEELDPKKVFYVLPRCPFYKGGMCQEKLSRDKYGCNELWCVTKVKYEEEKKRGGRE